MVTQVRVDSGGYSHQHQQRTQGYCYGGDKGSTFLASVIGGREEEGNSNR